MVKTMQWRQKHVFTYCTIVLHIHYTADQDRVAGYTPSHHLDAFSTYETSEAMTTATLLIYSLQKEGLINGLQTFSIHYSTKNTFKHWLQRDARRDNLFTSPLPVSSSRKPFPCHVSPTMLKVCGRLVVQWTQTPYCSNNLPYNPLHSVYLWSISNHTRNFCKPRTVVSLFASIVYSQKICLAKKYILCIHQHQKRLSKDPY